MTANRDLPQVCQLSEVPIRIPGCDHGQPGLPPGAGCAAITDGGIRQKRFQHCHLRFPRQNRPEREIDSHSGRRQQSVQHRTCPAHIQSILRAVDSRGGVAAMTEPRLDPLLLQCRTDTGKSLKLQSGIILRVLCLLIGAGKPGFQDPS